jgi:hypothetical protein
MTHQTNKTFTFNVLVEHVQDMCIATCLEMYLVATSDDENDLISKMSKLIVRQVEFALKNENPQDIFHPAPKDIWDKFMKQNGLRPLSESLNALSLNDTRGVSVSQTYAAAC